MYLIFTDLDGTLLDHHTYSYAESQEGIDILKEHGGVLILVSSKTFAEMSILHKELALDSPLLFENGSGIAYYDNGKWEIVISGEGVEALKEYTSLIEQETKHELIPIIDMSDEQLSAVTGLTPARAALAKKRQATVPFIFKDGYNLNIREIMKLNKIINKFKIALTRGGRFYHLIPGGSDKGTAVKKVEQYYAEKDSTIKTVGFGDSENDIAMLYAVDTAFVVRRHDGSVMKHDLKKIVTTDHSGPAGFTEGIKKYFKAG